MISDGNDYSLSCSYFMPYLFLFPKSGGESVFFMTNGCYYGTWYLRCKWCGVLMRWCSLSWESVRNVPSLNQRRPSVADRTTYSVTWASSCLHPNQCTSCPASPLSHTETSFLNAPCRLPGLMCPWFIVKNMGHGEGGHWLVRMEWRPAGWSVCLPL